ncbi:MAG: hypothetical protein HKN30_15760 [Sulfitobacter sp.]|nr:hypothetical protein [Sulfitobacter sp.]
MTGQEKAQVVLILGSGPNVVQAADWPKDWFDQIVVINNAWRVRHDWDTLVFPEDFPADRRPQKVTQGQQVVEADQFVPAQNRFGGFVHAGATMAYTTAYWVLAALQPAVMAFMGCDMTYAQAGKSHFYGKGTADPLRDDVSLRDLGAKSARLALIAAEQGCTCVNLSRDPSALLFPRAEPEGLRRRLLSLDLDGKRYGDLRAREEALGYSTPDGRHDALAGHVDLGAMDTLDRDWRSLFAKSLSEQGGTDAG